MTHKELLFLEDILRAERQLQKKCSDYADKVQDTRLKDILMQLTQQHNLHYSNLLNLMY